MTGPARRAASRAASAVIIGLSSRGGPGSSTTHAAVVSIHRPGALPCGFSSTSPPSGTIACRRLFRGIGAVKPREA